MEARPQAVLEAHLLDLQIELQRLHLLRHRYLRGRLVGECVAEEGGEAESIALAGSVCFSSTSVEIEFSVLNRKCGLSW
jgi:hypothetical protein